MGRNFGTANVPPFLTPNDDKSYAKGVIFVTTSRIISKFFNY
jgi:hypothetical protein